MLAQAQASSGAATSRFSLGQILRRSARLRGNALAIADIERELTWNAFEQRVMKLAGALRALGLKPGDRVAILAQNSHRYLETLFAVPWAGGVVAPFALAAMVIGAGSGSTAAGSGSAAASTTTGSGSGTRVNSALRNSSIPLPVAALVSTNGVSPPMLSGSTLRP